MRNDDRLSFAGGRQLVRELRGLGDVTAPSSLLGTVLTRVGLSDGYWQLDTPIGRVYVAYNTAGISAVMIAGDDEAFERDFQSRFHRPVHAVGRPPASLVRQVSEQLLGGKRRHLRYDLRGLTEFERAVLTKALEIPRGEVRPYAWIAREIGHPRAVRAVGSALANNPIPLLIPCHRVVRSDGSIGNYALGAAVKRVVLMGEGVEIETLEQLAEAGVRYYGSDSTRTYCFPTCRHARRVTDRHRVAFGSEAEAAASGYRPCKVCRPTAV